MKLNELERRAFHQQEKPAKLCSGLPQAEKRKPLTVLASQPSGPLNFPLRLPLSVLLLSTRSQDVCCCCLFGG